MSRYDNARVGGHYRRWLVRWLIIFVAVTVNGCVSRHPNYPEAWGAHSQYVGSDCSAISGLYVSSSVRSSWPSNTTPISLAQELYRLSQKDPGVGVPADLDGVTTVRLEVNPEGVVAELYDGMNKVRDLHFSEHHNSLSCDGHSLKLSYPNVNMVMLAVAAGHHTMVFYRNEDGSLIERFGYTDAALAFFVVPVFDSIYDWAQFAQSADAPGIQK